ncbi:MAG TPA: hypothetical protein VMW37_05335 [Dehalococcoidales bacterium]|nr:hypothetical protein [Dehalococcoidales bacterium]
MNKLIKAVIAGLIPILLMLLFPLNAGAAGFGVGPGKLEVTAALRGEEYQETVLAKYTAEANESQQCIIELNARGDISDWISFYNPSDPNTPIESITASAGEWTYILVKFNIPEDAPIGTATGTLYVQTGPLGEETEGGVTVSLQGTVDVTITVTGTAILTGTVEDISASDVELGYPLRIKVGFQNTGNVVAQPEITVAISKDGTAINSFNSTEAEVKVGSREIIPVVWDTAGRELGDYAARVAVSLGEKIISSKELNFVIMPAGTFSREGVFTELALEGNPRLGTIVKIQATFANTGLTDTKSKFIGEVYCDNELIVALESEESLVPVGQEETLMSYIKLESPGNYDIKGYINYEGKKTDVKEISFTLGEAGGGLPFSLSTPLIIGVIVVLIAVIAFVALRRRKAA